MRTNKEFYVEAMSLSKSNHIPVDCIVKGMLTSELVGLSHQCYLMRCVRRTSNAPELPPEYEDVYKTLIRELRDLRDHFGGAKSLRKLIENNRG